jgi:GT2 family glycosyltransferase
LRWITEKDEGQSQAINRGFQLSGGEILGFLNSDDLYEPGALLRVGEFFRIHPQAAWVTGRCRIIDREGNEIRKGVTLYKNLWLRTRSYSALCILNYISQPATFWRRTVWEDVGPLDDRLKYTMDYDYWLRVGHKYRLWVAPGDLARFRVHPSSKAGSSASAQLEIARRHVRSPFLLGLHRIHTAAIVTIYRRLLAREHAEARAAGSDTRI